ncbi:MAG: hypothetical protein ACE5KO_03355 [Candidatus Bathyarchaeia archaeon]
MNPFEIEVKETLEAVRNVLSKWKSFDEFLLDAEAVNDLSKVIKLQGDWLKYRSSNLYVDPALIELKIRTMSIEEIAHAFVKAWHPIVELEMITPKRIKEALDYWNQLAPKNERELKLSWKGSEGGKISEDELARLGFLSEKEFSEIMKSLWFELKQKTQGKKIHYWHFIRTSTYEETVRRAYLTSFLVTYGYARLEVNPIEEEITIIPIDNPNPEFTFKQTLTSLPISVGYDQWRRGGG